MARRSEQKEPEEDILQDRSQINICAAKIRSEDKGVDQCGGRWQERRRRWQAHRNLQRRKVQRNQDKPHCSETPWIHIPLHHQHKVARCSSCNCAVLDEGKAREEDRIFEELSLAREDAFYESFEDQRSCVLLPSTLSTAQKDSLRVESGKRSQPSHNEGRRRTPPPPPPPAPPPPPHARDRPVGFQREHHAL